VRNFRQALASPHSVQYVPRFGATLRGLVRAQALAKNPTEGQATMNRRQAPIHVVLLLCLIALTSACALSLRNPSIAELQRHPGRYCDRTVSISGIVTNSWGVPLVPFRWYKVDDGTGEVTVVSEGVRSPARGERVRVKGRVNELAVFGGQTVGLHLREEDLYVKR